MNSLHEFFELILFNPIFSLPWTIAHGPKVSPKGKFGQIQKLVLSPKPEKPCPPKIGVYAFWHQPLLAWIFQPILFFDPKDENLNENKNEQISKTWKAMPTNLGAHEYLINLCLLIFFGVMLWCKVFWQFSLSTTGVKPVVTQISKYVLYTYTGT